MGKFEEYAKKENKYQRYEFYDEEKEKGISSQNSTDPLFVTDLTDQFQKRIQKETTFEERTRYYFEDYNLLDAKVERYRNMAADGQALEKYAQTHTNHKAKDRKGYAKDAAANFEKAAKLALNFDAEKTKGFALYQHREKIMRLRMKGMEKAAMAKSKDAEDETYRKLKGKLSCLSILKDQLEVLSQDQKLTPKEINQFRDERVKLEKELEGVKNDLMTKIPSPVQQWERAQGIDDASIKRNLPTIKRQYPYTNVDAEKYLGIIQYYANEKKRSEYTTNYANMVRNKTFPSLTDSVGQLDRVLAHPCRMVLRDGQGNPINAAELKKDQWNKKWLKAAGDNDKATMHKMLKEVYERFERIEMPTPEELRSKGVMHFFKKDPAGFYDMIHIGLTLSNMCGVDDFAKEYADSHPVFNQKTLMASQLGALWSIELKSSKYLIDEQQAKRVGANARSLDEFRRSDREYAPVGDMHRQNYESLHSQLQEFYKSDRKKDMRTAEEHVESVSDMKDEVYENIGKLREQKREKDKDISPELKELESSIKFFDRYMEKKVPLVETNNREEGFDYSVLMIESWYNDISANVDKCLKKSRNYDGLKYGKETLQKLKRQCKAEVEAFRGAAVQYRKAIQKGTIGPFEKGKEPRWGDVLNYTRSVIYDLDKTGEGELSAVEGGGGQSEILFIARKAENVAEPVMKELHGRERLNTKIVFREDDIQRRDDFSAMIDDVIGKMDLRIDDKEIAEKIRKDMITALKKDLKTNGKDTFGRMLGGARNMEFYPTMLRDAPKYEEARKNGTRPTQVSGWKEMFKIFHKPEYMQYKGHITTAMDKLGKASHHRNMAAYNAYIKDGRNISNRNIATSRLATLLHIEEIVCDSRSAFIRQNGKLKKGVAMENSGGKEGGDLLDEAKSKFMGIKYSDKAIGQLFTLQIFDALCGQIDRNQANFHVNHVVDEKTNTNVITGIKCLDSDMAFGDFKNIKKGFNRLRPVNERNIMGLPIEVLNRIMVMTPGLFARTMGDLLQKDELDVLAQRLDIIKEEVRSLEKKNVLEKYNGQYRYKDEEMRDDTLRQLMMLKDLNNEVANNKKNKVGDHIEKCLDRMYKVSVFVDDILADKDGAGTADVEAALDRRIEERRQELTRIKQGKLDEKKKKAEEIAKKSYENGNMTFEAEQVFEKKLDRMFAGQPRKEEREKKRGGEQVIEFTAFIGSRQVTIKHTFKEGEEIDIEALIEQEKERLKKQPVNKEPVKKDSGSKIIGKKPVDRKPIEKNVEKKNVEKKTVETKTGIVKDTSKQQNKNDFRNKLDIFENKNKKDQTGKVISDRKNITKESVTEEKNTKKEVSRKVIQEVKFETDQKVLWMQYNASKGTQTELKTKYERQGKHNCFACSGTALLNQYIANKTGQKKYSKYNQMDMRNIKASDYLQKYEDVKHIFPNKADYEREVAKNTANIGKDTDAYNGIFELADFFLKQEPGLEVHQQSYAVNYEDKRVRDAQKKQFVTQIEKVLKTGNLVSLFQKDHYVTITGIKGGIVEYMDSLSDETLKIGGEIRKPKYASVDELFTEKKAGMVMSITWLAKLGDPNKLTKDYDYLGFNGKGFYLKGANPVYQYDLMQSKGVVGSKQLGNGIKDDVYVPKTINAQKASYNRNNMNMIIEEDEDRKSNISHKSGSKNNIFKEKPKPGSNNKIPGNKTKGGKKK